MICNLCILVFLYLCLFIFMFTIIVDGIFSPRGHPTWLPHTKLSLILEIFTFSNYSYFAKIMTRKPKIANLTNMTER